MSPLFNSNNLLMGDDQSSLSIIALIGSDKPHSTFSVDAADTDLDADAPLFTRSERTSSSREGGGGRKFDGINCRSSRFSPISDGGATPVVEAPPALIPTFLSRTTRESPNAGGEPGHLAIAASKVSAQSWEENGQEAAPEQRPDHRPSRRASRFQTAPTTTKTIQPAEEVQAFCQLLVDLRTSLSQGMQSILSNLSHAPLRPGLQGLASTALTALIGLEKSLQPLCPSFAQPLSTSPLPLLRLQTSPVEESPAPQPRRSRGPPLRRLPRPFLVLMQ